MAKYYVTANMKNPDKNYRHIVTAASASDAAALVWQRLRLPIEGSEWIISERGFGTHEDFDDSRAVMKSVEVAKVLAKIKKKRDNP